MAAIHLTDEEAELRRLLLDTSAFIHRSGYTKPILRFTGGWVRDKLLGATSKDVDVGISSMTGYDFGLLMESYLDTEGKAEYPQSKIRKVAKIEANPEKSKHLETATTKVFDIDLDLVNLRKEAYEESSRNPTMDFGTPEEDALRRDATVNALFYNLHTLEVEDFTTRGLADLERRIIKTPLPPYQTFKDDPLRVLRAIRFASRLGFKIDDEDKQAMRDEEIKGALKLKIVRERVGIEVLKMLTGSNPHTALSLIDELDLYDIIFTSFASSSSDTPQPERWKRSYDKLLEIDQAISGEKRDHNSQLLKSSLLQTQADIDRAWIICAFIPWAKIPQPPKVGKSKPALTSAATAARLGLKVSNDIINVVEAAAVSCEDIVKIKDVSNEQTAATTSPLKRKAEAVSRENLGMAIRRWGKFWRSSVVYALLVEVKDNEDESRLLVSYAAWLSTLKELDLFNACELKPLVNGKELSTALNDGKTGPWVSKALEMVIRWQLRNPEETFSNESPEEIKSRIKGAIIEEVGSKRKELGLVEH